MNPILSSVTDKMLFFLKGPMKFIFLSLILFSVLGEAKPAKKFSRKPSSIQRPPQFVMLAFDGSKDVNFWKESVEFADTVKTNNENEKASNLMRFTYFVNPTYYTDPAHKENYKIPALNKSLSCIGYSENKAIIVTRIDRTNNAFNKGHEIGSHANSHCNAAGADKNDPLYGHPWSEEDWSSEFEQFNKLLFNSYVLNELGTPKNYPPNGFAFKETDVVGFRAPILATTDGLWPTLSKFRFRYDTSKTSQPTYWPQKQVWGGWNFPLALIKIAGTTRSTLSMDYNWLYYHSAGASKPDLTVEERERFKQQMLDSYMYYFKINYFGGRAPVHIGHHFSKWNNGAYWQAMQEFATLVCHKPEVRCVTYTEYANWLDRQDNDLLANYRKGNFEKLPDDKSIKDIASPVLANVRIESNDKGFEAVIDSSDIKKARLTNTKVVLQVNFKTQESNFISREELVKQFGQGHNEVLLRATLLNSKKQEINWATYRIKNLGLTSETLSEPIEDQAVNPAIESGAHNDD